MYTVYYSDCQSHIRLSNEISTYQTRTDLADHSWPPPGAGKGTQREVLAEKLGIPHISTGDLLRDHIRRETQLGVRVKEIIDGGLRCQMNLC